MFTPKDRIANRLLLESNSLTDIGLLYGKMGIAIVFAQQWRKFDDHLYERTFGELLDIVIENSHKGLSYDFAKGLAGIGWGIEYLLQNGYVEGDGVEICEEIDKFIMRYDPRRIDDLSLDTGIEGLLHYVLAHIQGATDSMPFDELYLNDLTTSIKNIDVEQADDSLKQLIKSYLDFHDYKKPIHYNMDVKQFAVYEQIDESKLVEYPLGLQKGLAANFLFDE